LFTKILCNIHALTKKMFGLMFPAQGHSTHLYIYCKTDSLLQKRVAPHYPTNEP